jgi:hypothetical protein
MQVSGLVKNVGLFGQQHVLNSNSVPHLSPGKCFRAQEGGHYQGPRHTNCLWANCVEGFWQDKDFSAQSVSQRGVGQD